jgi:hypothetical protein
MHDDYCVLGLHEIVYIFLAFCPLQHPFRHLALDHSGEMSQASFGVEPLDDFGNHHGEMTGFVVRGKKTPVPRPGVERCAAH